MSTRGYTITDQFAVHFITFAVVQWADVFTRRKYAEIVIESLQFCKQKKGLCIHAWCLMPNHVHLIVSAKEPARLSDILRDFKKFTSSMIVSAIDQNKRKVGEVGYYGFFEKQERRITEILNISLPAGRQVLATG